MTSGKYDKWEDIFVINLYTPENGAYLLDKKRSRILTLSHTFSKLEMTRYDRSREAGRSI